MENEELVEQPLVDDVENAPIQANSISEGTSSIDVFIDNLIAQGKISREEIERRVEESRVPLEVNPEILALQQENKFLSVQLEASTQRADFQEEVLTELIMTLMP